MDAKEIDNLFEAFEYNDFEQLLRYADIKANQYQSAREIYEEKKEEILAIIMKKIENGDYDYFYSKKDSDSYDDIPNFAQLMRYSSKVDDIKKIINDKREIGLIQEEVIGLIVATKDVDYIKSFIEDTEKRAELDIDFFPYEFVELLKATKDAEYIKSFIENREKRRECRVLFFPEHILELIKETGDIEYIKGIIDSKEKRERFEINYNIPNKSFRELIIATKDPEYIKGYIEDDKKIAGLEITLFDNDFLELIKATNDIEYIKSYIEDAEKRVKKGLIFGSSEFVKLLKATKDVEYIKSFIDSKEKRDRARMFLAPHDFVELITQTHDPEYIKSCIEDEEKIKELELRSGFYGGNGFKKLLKATHDSNYIRSCVEEKEKQSKLGVKFFSDDVIDLIYSMNDLTYIRNLLNNKDKRKELDLCFDDVIECISLLDRSKISECIFDIQNNFSESILDSKRKIKLPENMTIGMEIESEGRHSDFILKLSNLIEKSWKCKSDISLTDGVEVVSPILTGDNQKNTNSISKVCQTLKYLGQDVSNRCGGHIHIGSEYLTSSQSWMNLIEIWGNSEEILYTISNTEGELPRRGISEFAIPISREFEILLAYGSIQLNSIGDFRNFVKTAQDTDRYFGINFQNLGGKKNTIEFRLANGTLDENTWNENINLFGGLVVASEELAKIQSKSLEELTEEEKQKLVCLEKIKDSEISSKEKLDALLMLVIPEEDREIYRRRYKINSELIEMEPVIRKDITEKMAKKSITVKKMAKKIFSGEKAVNGQDYEKSTQILHNSLKKEGKDLKLEKENTNEPGRN